MQVASTDIITVQEKIKWIEDSIAGKTPLYDLLTTRAAKQQLILLWAKYLEELAKAGVYQKPIFTISTHITNRLREMNVNNSWDYVRHVLPFKYKDSSFDHSNLDDQRGQDNRDISSNFETENNQMISLCDDTAQILDMVADKLKTKPFMSKLSKEQRENQNEYFLKWRNMLDSLKQVADERNEVPHSKQFLFLYSKTLGTLGHTYTTFVLHLRNFATISTKQATKLINGKSSYLDPMYEPKNRLQARDIGFYGFPCDQCGSWRTELVYHPKQDEVGKDEVYCYRCHEWTEPKTELLPKPN